MMRWGVLAAAVLLLVTAGGAGAFEDTVQRYPTGKISDLWSVTTSGSAWVTIVQRPTGYTSNMCIEPFTYTGGTVVLSPYDTLSLGYFSFVNYYVFQTGDFHLAYYDTKGFHIDDSANIGATLGSYCDHDLHEFIKSGNTVKYYVNGGYISDIANVADSTGYISLVHTSSINFKLGLDDFSNSGNTIGINEEVTDDEANITASYTLRAIHAHPSSEYIMNLIKVYPRETINSTILPTDIAGGDKPAGFVRWDRNTTVGENAGLYQITITRAGTKVGETTFYYKVGYNLGSVTWGKEAYSIGDPATITYSLIDPDFGTYTYKVQTMGLDGAVDGSWAVAAQSGTLNADLKDYGTGTEYAIFIRTDKTSGDTIEFAYDYATITETATILGNTTNAITGAAMEDVTITFKQGTEWYNTTSASDGTYNLTSLSSGIEITCNANVTYENHTQTVNEIFNSSDYDTWINLTQDMITSSSVLVSNATDETPFTISTDYNINYTDGRIMVLSTGSMINWTDYHIDYNTTESFTISPFSFTPIEPKAYCIDLYLFNVNHTYENTSIYGLVGNSHYYQAVEGAIVRIWNEAQNNTINVVNETFNSSNYDTWISLNNDIITSGSVLVSNTTDETPFIITTDYNMNYTDGKIMVLSIGNMSNWTDYHIDYNATDVIAAWNDTTQTTATGYYVFHNLNNSTAYNLNASAAGYETSSDYDVTATDNATRQDIQLVQLFTVTIRAKDATTTAYINTFTAYFDSQTNATITGTATFTNVKYGVYSVSAAADGYYPDATTAIIDEDETATLTLVRMESQYYTPHHVKFKVVNVFGNVYQNVATLVYTGATASGDTYANGTTGSDGAVVFKLTENIQYTLTFTNATQGIDKTVTLYPKDREYYIIVGTTSTWSDYEHRKHDEIHITITNEVINDSHAYINISYSDALSGTTLLEAFINQTNLSDPYNQTMAYYHSFAGNLNDTNHSFLISPHSGEAFFIRVHHEHTEFGTNYDSTVRFWGMRIDLGLPSGVYIYICIMLTLFVAGIFGGTSTQVGSIVICVMGWLFLVFGWLHALGWFAEISVTLASIYAVATIITHRARKAGYT